MPEQDYERTAAANELDRQLDAAFAKYAAIEPRAGLEERVLANLRAQQMQALNRRWLQWGWAVSAVAIFVVTVTLAWKSGKASRPLIANHPSVAAPSPKVPEMQAANRDGNLVQAEPKTIRKTHMHPAQSKAVVPANPKLGQFPSPRPLSEQEKLLLSYVSNDPERAALVAEARMESLRRDRVEKLREAAADTNEDLPPQ